MKKTVATIAIAIALCLAQDAPEKLAVYVYGASSEGINKSLGSKLLAAMSQSGNYAEVVDLGAFQNELAKVGNAGVAQIYQAAKRYGADYVCDVNMVEAFGAYSITARLIRIADLQVVKTGSADRAFKSLEDLTAASNELARQLLPPGALQPPPAAVAPPSVEAPPVAGSAAPLAFIASGSFGEAAPASIAPPIDRVAAAQAAVQKKCPKTYNINELLFKIKDGFPGKLKDCASKLAKDMLTPASFGGRKLEPTSFMKQCPVDGIKSEIPDGFPGADKVVGSIDNFVQGILNSASAGGGLDPKKLVSAVGSISVSINTLLNDIKELANNECIVNKPYEPPAEQASKYEEDDSEDEEDKSMVSFGIRAGFNFSHIYAEYNYSRGGSYSDIVGMQFGFVLDIAAGEVFHIQPGIIYVQKGMEDYKSDITAHYLEFPLLMSLKFSAFRLNAGPYWGVCLNAGNEDIFGNEFGLSTGFGFDIGMFYMGMFYDYGLSDMGKISNSYFYNRTLGFNLGINL